MLAVMENSASSEIPAQTIRNPSQTVQYVIRDPSNARFFRKTRGIHSRWVEKPQEATRFCSEEDAKNRIRIYAPVFTGFERLEYVPLSSVIQTRAADSTAQGPLYPYASGSVYRKYIICTQDYSLFLREMSCGATAWTSSIDRAMSFRNLSSAFQARRQIGNGGFCNTAVGPPIVCGAGRNGLSPYSYDMLSPLAFRELCDRAENLTTDFWPRTAKWLEGLFRDHRSVVCSLNPGNVLHLTALSAELDQIRVVEDFGFHLRIRTRFSLTYRNLTDPEQKPELRKATLTWTSDGYTARQVSDSEHLRGIRSFLLRASSQFRGYVIREVPPYAVIEGAHPSFDFEDLLQIPGSADSVPERKQLTQAMLLCEIRGHLHTYHGLTVDFFSPLQGDPNRSAYNLYMSTAGRDYIAFADSLDNAVRCTAKGTMQWSGGLDCRPSNDLRVMAQVMRLLEEPFWDGPVPVTLNLVTPLQDCTLRFPQAVLSLAGLVKDRFPERNLKYGASTDAQCAFLREILRLTGPLLAQELEKERVRLSSFHLPRAELSFLEIAQSYRGCGSRVFLPSEKDHQLFTVGDVFSFLDTDLLPKGILRVADHLSQMGFLKRKVRDDTPPETWPCQIRSLALPWWVPDGVETAAYSVADIPYLKPERILPLLPSVIARLRDPDTLWELLSALEMYMPAGDLLKFRQTEAGREFFERFQGAEREYVDSLLWMLEQEAASPDDDPEEEEPGKPTLCGA